MGYNAYEVGQRASSARRDKNISQLEISEQLKISQTTLSRFENGIGYLSLENAVKLCELLDVPLLWLVGDQSAHLTSDEHRALEQYKQFLVNKRTNKN